LLLIHSLFMDLKKHILKRFIEVLFTQLSSPLVCKSIGKQIQTITFFQGNFVVGKFSLQLIANKQFIGFGFNKFIVS